MTEYSNTNRGALFKAKERKTDSHPEYTGSINIDGIDCWLSAWVKESKAGEKYFSLSVKAKEVRDSVPPPVVEPDLEDDLPF